jgi:hypothetical protein
MATSTRSIEFSVRIYKMLIKAYPASFRREYENEMALVFREHITDVMQKRGMLGLLTAWFRLLGDLACSAPKEHFREMQRRIAMKNAAMAVLSVFLAAIAYFIISAGIAFIGLIPFMADVNHSVLKIITFPVLYISAFLTGLILTRVKPYFAPFATVPLGTMAIWTITGIGAFVEDEQNGSSPWWAKLIMIFGFVASAGLATVLGCIVSRKASIRLPKFSIPWFQLIGPLTILICTSIIACVLRITLTGKQIITDPLLRQSLTFCLYGLFVIAAVTIANTVILVVRTYQKAKVQ